MRQQCIRKNYWQGGVHLDDYWYHQNGRSFFKSVKEECLLQDAYLYIPLPQKECHVKKGKSVDRFTLLAENVAELKEDRHYIYAPAAGYIADIRKYRISYNKWMRYLVFKCEDDTCSLPEFCNTFDMRERLNKSGIPKINQVLFDKNKQKNVDAVVLNLISDDPTNCICSVYMENYAGHLLYGMKKLKDLLHAEQMIIACSQFQKKSADVMLRTINRLMPKENIDFLFVPDIYPGAREMLFLENVKGVYGVKQYQIITAIQAKGVYDCLYDDKPWTEVPVVIQKGTQTIIYESVPIGLPVLRLWPEFDMFSDQLMVKGGLIGGEAVDPRKAIVDQSTGCLLAVDRQQRIEEMCCQCGVCRDVCPMRYEPDVDHGVMKKCLQCGCCNYICPAGRQLKERMAHGKIWTPDENKNYFYLSEKDKNCIPSVKTGYTAPFMRKDQMPFACILGPFKL